MYTPLKSNTFTYWEEEFGEDIVSDPVITFVDSVETGEDYFLGGWGMLG
ncbi:hypothetical protein SS1G_08598 [Sclerotinia sclerotiorum 1980 UF-70]|uniref:Uncharacterized protein n=1 Tax=Sclerotinia sclerotiorum (strain ATCC 18683 / 1980 / Ss-1) TaxID=665079 RepID=A7ETE3_SCLS1|nr:hypothetical protein SS1G_08598 [Sclerotinia sclerotiorum 1980 UF-70]EDN92735.1 hypothetical protein SS1G_08598 [Sclerotinia sclerotiorum 1980 UF-70]